MHEFIPVAFWAIRSFAPGKMSHVRETWHSEIYKVEIGHDWREKRYRKFEIVAGTRVEQRGAPDWLQNFFFERLW